MNRRATVSRPHGTTIVTTEMGRVITRDTLQCVHCGMHWEHKPGSGRIRGHCYRCNGPVCGPKCVDCHPLQKKLDDAAAGKIIIP